MPSLPDHLQRALATDKPLTPELEAEADAWLEQVLKPEIRDAREAFNEREWQKPDGQPITSEPPYGLDEKLWERPPQVSPDAQR